MIHFRFPLSSFINFSNQETGYPVMQVSEEEQPVALRNAWKMPWRRSQSRDTNSLLCISGPQQAWGYWSESESSQLCAKGFFLINDDKMISRDSIYILYFTLYNLPYICYLWFRANKVFF